MVVLRPVVDEQEDSRRRKARHQRVEEALGVGIDPVKVFEYQAQRLDLALPEEHAPQAVYGPPAALPGVEGVPRGVVGRHVQEGKEARHHGSQRLVERQELARDLLPDAARIIARLDPEIALAEIDDGQIGAGLAIGDRARLEHEPVLGPVRVDELPEQARLPHPGLAHHGDDLPQSPSCRVEGLAEMVQLLGAPHEAGEPPGRGRLKARARHRWSGQLEHVDRARHPLDRDRTDRNDLNEPLGELERLAGEPRRARSCELLHARGQVGGLAHRRVVHPQIASDGPHDHLAGVEADADLHLDSVIPTNLGRVLAHGLLHGERGVAGADGVVFVGEGRTKERHDAIAHDLVHGAFVAVHRLHHALEDRVQELARLLGVSVGE